MSLPLNNLAFVAVGSNIEPEKHVPLALDRLRKTASVLASSTFYQTAPLGRPDQPPFINGVWLLDTSLAPRPLRETVLLPIEAQLGRIRSEDKYAPRPMDLDLVLYNAWECHEPDLRLPHPDLERPFINQPVRELLKLDWIPDTLRMGLENLLPPLVPDAAIGTALTPLTERLRAGLQT